MEKEQAVIAAFLRKEHRYRIAVRNASMLPKELQQAQEITFGIKPPTPYVLALCAEVLLEVPDLELNTEASLELVGEYQEIIASLVALLSYEASDYPEWYVPFICKNVSQMELLQILQELAVKCNPSFFLTSIQLAKNSNPMLLQLPS